MAKKDKIETKKPAESVGQQKPIDMAFSKKPLEPAVIEKRPSQTFTEILAEPKKPPVDAPVPKHPYPETPVVTEFVKADLRPDKSEPVIVKAAKPKLESKYDFLRVPLGLFDFENAGVLFKNAEAPNNRKFVEQWNDLLAAGYAVTLRTIDNNYAYFQFQKN